MKVLDFVKKYKEKRSEDKLDKSLFNSAPKVITLFNNDYEIIKKIAGNRVILKDKKGYKFWMQEEHLGKMLKKGKASIYTLSKADVSKPGSRGGKVVGYDKSGNPIYESGHIQSGRRSDGKHAIDIATGHAYEHHGDEAEKVRAIDRMTPPEKEQMKRLVDYIRTNADAKDHPEGAKILNEYAEVKDRLRNIKDHLTDEMKRRGNRAKMLSHEEQTLTRIEKEKNSVKKKLESFISSKTKK